MLISKDVSLWANSMKNVPCFLIGNGPSLKDVDLKIIKHYFSVGINRAFLKIDPTILMWQDQSLWLKEKKNVKKLKALKYCRKRASLNYKDVYTFQLKDMNKPGGSKLTTNPKKLYGRGSSSALAFQFAYSLGCDPIILLGFDCKNDGKNTDFYGVNPMHTSSTLAFCNKALKWIKKCGSGKRIISCSNNDRFDNIKLEEALNTIDNLEKKKREEWIKMLFKKC